MVFLDHLKPLYTVDIKVMEEEGLIGPVSCILFSSQSHTIVPKAMQWVPSPDLVGRRGRSPSRFLSTPRPLPHIPTVTLVPLAYEKGLYHLLSYPLRFTTQSNTFHITYHHGTPLTHREPSSSQTTWSNPETQLTSPMSEPPLSRSENHYLHPDSPNNHLPLQTPPLTMHGTLLSETDHWRKRDGHQTRPMERLPMVIHPSSTLVRCWTVGTLIPVRRMLVRYQYVLEGSESIFMSTGM